jgi:hypothetical protein
VLIRAALLISLIAVLMTLAMLAPVGVPATPVLWYAVLAVPLTSTIAAVLAGYDAGSPWRPSFLGAVRLPTWRSYNAHSALRRPSALVSLRLSARMIPRPRAVPSRSSAT